MYDIGGKVALVTGGTRGIGLAAASHLLRHGAKVLLNARAETEEANALAEEYGRENVLVEAADAAKSDTAARLVAVAVERFGRLDIVIPSAGGPVPGRVTEIDPEDWFAAFDVHLHSVYHLFRAAHPHLAKEGGAVVLVSSVAGLRGCPGTVAYQTVKGALIPLARALAFDHARESIRINVVAPGIIRTRFHERMSDDARAHNINNRILLGREGTTDDVASAILELIRNDFVTGEVMTVDGGMSMRMTG